MGSGIIELVLRENVKTVDINLGIFNMYIVF